LIIPLFSNDSNTRSNTNFDQANKSPFTSDVSRYKSGANPFGNNDRLQRSPNRSGQAQSNSKSPFGQNSDGFAKSSFNFGSTNTTFGDTKKALGSNKSPFDISSVNTTSREVSNNTFGNKPGTISFGRPNNSNNFGSSSGKSPFGGSSKLFQNSNSDSNSTIPFGKTSTVNRGGFGKTSVQGGGGFDQTKSLNPFDQTKSLNPFDQTKSSNPFGQISTNSESQINSTGNEVQNRTRPQAEFSGFQPQNCQYDGYGPPPELAKIFQEILADPYGKGTNMNNQTPSFYPLQPQSHQYIQNQENMNLFNDSQPSFHEYAPANPMPIMKHP
jgi:hypothetical protein